MEFKGWVTDYTRSSFEGITLNEVMLFVVYLQKMVPEEVHHYIERNQTRTEQGNWPTKTITMIGLLKVVEDEFKNVRTKF